MTISDTTRRKRDGWPATMRACEGRMARTTKPLANGHMTIPRGTLVEIRISTGWDRLSLRADPCGHCGVKPHISGVSWRDLEMLPETPELHLGDSLPADVRRLVIAARAIAFGDARPVTGEPELLEQFAELDKASEAFAGRVPWEMDA